MYHSAALMSSLYFYIALNLEGRTPNSLCPLTSMHNRVPSAETRVSFVTSPTFIYFSISQLF